MISATHLQDIVADIAAEHIRQREKHGDESCQDLPAGHRAWLPILVEEVGEVATEVANLDPGHEPVDLRKELVQVAAVTIAWIAAIDREAEQ